MTRTPTPALATAGSGAVTKVLAFIVENHSLGQMKSQMPYTFGLAQRFGYATNYTIVHQKGWTATATPSEVTWHL